MNTFTRSETRCFLSIFLLTFLTACSSHTPTIQPITESSVVVAFGDSLTAGTGATQNEAYPAILGQRLGCTVHNEGIPGQTTSQGLARLPELIERLKPTHLILCYGGNDFLQDVKEETIRSNLNSMLDLLATAQCDVLIIGVPKATLALSKADFYEEIAKQRGLACDNTTLRSILTRASLKSDQIHPNADGYKMMAEAVEELIRGATE